MHSSLLSILRILADKRIHSGLKIGQELGISRAAVWKNIQRFDSLGLSVNSIKGVGYQLQDDVDLIDIAALERSIQSGSSCTIEYCVDIDSTSLHLQRLLTAGQAKHGYCVVAEAQTAGRGRRGNVWVSPFAQNIYLSILYDFDGGIAALEGLSLAVGVSVVSALHDVLGMQLSLKWPNDIVANGKKYGGILVDIAGESDGNCHAIIGIGLNVHMKQSVQSINQAWGALDSLGTYCSRTVILEAVLKKLFDDLHLFKAHGFANFKKAWAALDAFAGQQVSVSSGAEFVIGVCAGVSDRGELRIITATGERSFVSGEVSLRLL